MSGLATQPARASGEFTIDANIPLADQLGALVARLATAAKIHPAHVVPDATGLLSGAFFCRHE